MKFESSFGIGDTVRFLDDQNQFQEGEIFAVTVAEVGPNCVGYWYKIRLQSEVEVEVEEAGAEMALISAAKRG